MKNRILVVLLMALSLVPIVNFAQNPIIQTNYTADPAPMVHNDTVYLYTTHDEDNTVNNFFSMNDWKCYSSTDMVNWTDHGTVFSYTDFSWARGDAWAGQCVFRNGKYYFYVPVNQKNGGNAIGVAVSDSPTGPFKDALGKPLAVGNGYIDPTVFIDDDGQAYLYWGNPDLYYVKLNENMTSYNKAVGVVKVPLTVAGFGPRSNTDRATSYEEGPWFFKRNNLYYMLYPGGPLPEFFAYSTSTGPTGPWEYRGKFMAAIADKGAFTNHPGTIDFKGKSYLFYHNAGLPGGGGYKRSVCVEEFAFNENGTIPVIAPTKTGVVKSASNLNPYQLNQAEMIAWEEGVETEKCSRGGMNVYSIENGDYIKIRSVDFGTIGAASFSATVSSATNGGTIELRLNSTIGPLIGTLPANYTGGWDNWKSEMTTVSGATGVHDLYLIFKGSANTSLFKLDDWRFNQKSETHELTGINAVIGNYKIDTISGSNTTTLKVWAIYSDGKSEDVTSGAEIFAQQEGIVDVSNGIIKGVLYNPVALTITYQGKADTVNLLIKDLKSEITAKSLRLDQDSIKLLSGTTAKVVVTVEYYDGHTEDVTTKARYKNADNLVATILSGKITAKSKGTTSVSVSFKGSLGNAVTDTFSINVYNNDPFVRNEAEKYNDQSGIQTEACNDTGGSDNVAFIENGDWLRINTLDFDLGAASFNARVSSAGSGGKIEIHLDSPTGTLMGTCTVKATGNWNTWQTQTCPVSNVTGLHNVYLVFKGGSGYLFNLNWWKFNAVLTSVADKKDVQSIEVISIQNEKYLKGLESGDVVTFYTSSGQKVNTVRATSDTIPLKGLLGFFLIEVKRQHQTYFIKSIV